MKRTFGIIIISFISGLTGAWIFNHYIHEDQIQNPDMESAVQFIKNSPTEELPDNRINPNRVIPDMNNNFVEASAISTQSVVYIKNISERSYSTWLDYFLEGGSSHSDRVSTGSGVVFSKDGYIVTNNHVVEGANRLEVIFNKNSYSAELIGTDPSTDLAVLKIDAKNLPTIPLGNSNELHVGEWVIAVGNPFNLTSTVTAGIVSAKGRDINILQDKFPIESFIQTDAAINPGNSGGALVNQAGQLVGINTAILSRTGSYTGYGFAVPVDIAKKVFFDIKTYGEVQKAFFGGDVEDFNSDIAKRLDINTKSTGYEGVLLVYLQHDGAAKNAGLKEGDIITAIDNQPIDSRSNFEEELSYRSPGDKITVSYERDNKEYSVTMVLTNREGTTEVLKRKVYKSNRLGAEFEEISKVERELLKIESGGVRVFNIGRGKLAGMEEDFVITHINRTSIQSAEKLIEILENIKGIIWIEGVDKKGNRGRYKMYGN